ncbi:MAG: DUF4245 domain-containing protein [Nocardioides sp.]
MSGQQPPEQGGRYNRTANGLIGSMIITVLAVVGFVLFRGLFSDEPDQGRPEPIDYLPSVQQLQTNDYEPVYPATLPEGWIVTNLDVDPGERPAYGLNFYTPDDEFVGLRQADEDVDELLAEFVDENPVEEDPLTGVAFGSTWEGWSDEGGDRAYSTTFGDDTVLVFGDVSADELAELVALLGTTPLPAP